MSLVPANAVRKRRQYASGGGAEAIPQVPVGAAIAAGEYKRSGGIEGTSTGRGDAVKASVPPDSFIIPADVVAAVGDGNSDSGKAVLQKMFIDPPQMPGPTPAMEPPAAGPEIPRGGFKKGGGLRPAGVPVRAPQEGTAVPIKVSPGEFVVPPEKVAERGGGDVQKGHDILAEFVDTVRKKWTQKLKKLPKPRS